MTNCKIGDKVYWYDGGGHWGEYHGVVKNIDDETVTIHWDANLRRTDQPAKDETFMRVDFDRWVTSGDFEINKGR